MCVLSQNFKKPEFGIETGHEIVNLAAITLRQNFKKPEFGIETYRIWNYPIEQQRQNFKKPEFGIETYRIWNYPIEQPASEL